MTLRGGTTRSVSGLRKGEMFAPCVACVRPPRREWPAGSRVLLADAVDASRMTCIAREHRVMGDSNGNNAANRGLTSRKIGKSPKKWTHRLIWDTLSTQ